MTNKLLKKMKDRAKPNVQGSDFKKKKAKLGQKQVSASATKTSFQSKVLHMPSQSMIEEKGEVVTSRNLTLKDLLIQLSHYSEGVRKDALIGIKELLTKYPYLIPLHFGAVLEKLLNVITDGDPIVRQNLVSLFEYIIPHLELETLSAYFPVIRVYLLAGLTHMYNTVRMSSLAIVELWLNNFPSLIVPISDQLLPTFIVVLQSVAAPVEGTGSSKSTTKKAPPALEKQSVLVNLKKLLRALADQHISNDSGPKHFQSGEINSKKSAEAPSLVWESSHKNEIVMNHDYAVFLERQASFFPPTYTTTTSTVTASTSTSTETTPSSDSTSTSTSTTPATPESPATPTNAPVPSSISQQEPSSHTDSWQFLHEFFNKLFPLLMNNWVEIVTSAQAITTNATSQNALNKLELPYLELLDTLLQILHFILELLGDSAKVGKRVQIEKYMVPYFPVQSNSADITLDINVHMCNVFAHFLEPKNEQQVPLVSSMVQFTIGQLQNANQVKTYSHKLMGLIPVVRKLLSCVGNATAQNILQAFMAFDENSHPSSAAKRAIVEFVSEILQAHQSKTAPYKPSDKIANIAVLSFPKLLFKLSTNNLPTTQSIIKALALFGRGRSPIYETVQLPLVPFFFTLLKPSAKHPKGARVFGPFVHLPAQLQQDVLDLLYYFPALSPNLEKGLMACCLHPSVSALVVSRVVEIVQHHFNRKHDVAVDHYVAFLAGLLVGVGQKLGGTAGKRKREMSGDDDEVMEVPKEEVEAEKTADEVSSKEQMLPEKVKDVCERVCWSFGLVSGTQGIQAVTKMVFPILCATLEERPNIAMQYCIINLIAAIYKCDIGTTWDSSEAPKLDDSMKLRLPHTLAEYLLSIAVHGQAAEKEFTSCVYNIFNLWPSVFAQVLTIFTQHLNKAGTSKLWQVVEVLLACVEERDLENTLLTEQCKTELLNIISVLKDPKFASESANTTVLGKLCSDVGLLYRL